MVPPDQLQTLLYDRLKRHWRDFVQQTNLPPVITTDEEYQEVKAVWERLREESAHQDDNPLHGLYVLYKNLLVNYDKDAR